jgi:hypothetical protein
VKRSAAGGAEGWLMSLSEEQKMYFERAQQEGFLLLHEYDPETHCDLGLEWRTWCIEKSEPFVQIEIYKRQAIVSYSLLRFPMVTDLTEAEIDELESFALHAHGSEAPECLPSHGRIGLIELADAQQIAGQMVEFCRAGIRHWQGGATDARYKPARREETA